MAEYTLGIIAISTDMNKPILETVFLIIALLLVNYLSTLFMFCLFIFHEYWLMLRNGNPLQCSCLENPRDGRGSLVGCRLWGCTESDTTEAT